MASTASSSLNKSINYEDPEEEISSLKKFTSVDLSSSQESAMEREEILCCGKKSLPKVFLLIFGLGALVGLVDYFLVKDDLERKHRGEKTQYLRSHKGVSIHSTFDEYVAFYGKSYSTVKEFKARKALFDASKLEIERVRVEDGDKATYTMELNEFADMTENEFKYFWTGGKHLDERLDSHSVFYDFENEVEIDNIY